ncbi:MAG: acetylornithine deacetylase [Solirubrobacteraceae bacterium]
MGQAVRAIDAWMAAREDELCALVSRLVACPSVNHVTWGEELAVQRLVAEHMRSIGLEVEEVPLVGLTALSAHPAYRPGRDYRDRPNVVGALAGTGGGRSLAFSGHADTVAPGPLPWSSPPHEPTRIGDRLHGLGTLDMKSGLAAALFAVEAVRELSVELRGDVVVESVVDEEYGGANGTLAGRLVGAGAGADAAIICEPTDLAIYPGNAGVGLFRVEFTGMPQGIDGGLRGGEALAVGRHFAGQVGQADWPRGGVELNWPLAAPVAPFALAINTPAVAHDRFDRLPSQVTVDLSMPALPGVDEETLLQAVDALAARAVADLGAAVAVAVRSVMPVLPSSAVAPDEPILGAAIRVARDALGVEPSIMTAPWGCDGFMFNLHSPTPAILWGPAGEGAHAPDEHVLVSSLLALARGYARVVLDWCG